MSIYLQIFSFFLFTESKFWTFSFYPYPRDIFLQEYTCSSLNKGEISNIKLIVYIQVEIWVMTATATHLYPNKQIRQEVKIINIIDQHSLIGVNNILDYLGGGGHIIFTQYLYDKYYFVLLLQYICQASTSYLVAIYSKSGLETHLPFSIISQNSLYRTRPSGIL